MRTESSGNLADIPSPAGAPSGAVAPSPAVTPDPDGVPSPAGVQGSRVRRALRVRRHGSPGAVVAGPVVPHRPVLRIVRNRTSCPLHSGGARRQGLSAGGTAVPHGEAGGGRAGTRIGGALPSAPKAKVSEFFR
ncbi:hypothetical protein GCM10010358_20890 [Streptomyces minutiscleroticus]|uniref:Uncharacterized protein n=1 Tax=Streptomyces minutiscleroticus TaxID=68238 RepID=A0A918KK66_9ACTN|nr:hypothetical protein GCM10010358_20890 [Streptomyces minutiscleroticus]